MLYLRNHFTVELLRLITLSPDEENPNNFAYSTAYAYMQYGGAYKYQQVSHITQPNSGGTQGIDSIPVVTRLRHNMVRQLGEFLV